MAGRVPKFRRASAGVAGISRAGAASAGRLCLRGRCCRRAHAFPPREPARQAPRTVQPVRWVPRAAADSRFAPAAPERRRPAPERRAARTTGGAGTTGAGAGVSRSDLNCGASRSVRSVGDSSISGINSRSIVGAGASSGRGSIRAGASRTGGTARRRDDRGLDCRGGGRLGTRRSLALQHGGRGRLHALWRCRFDRPRRRKVLGWGCGHREVGCSGCRCRRRSPYARRCHWRRWRRLGPYFERDDPHLWHDDLVDLDRRAEIDARQRVLGRQADRRREGGFDNRRRGRSGGRRRRSGGRRRGRRGARRPFRRSRRAFRGTREGRAGAAALVARRWLEQGLRDRGPRTQRHRQRIPPPGLRAVAGRASEHDDDQNMQQQRQHDELSERRRRQRDRRSQRHGAGVGTGHG